MKKKEKPFFLSENKHRKKMLTSFNGDFLPEVWLADFNSTVFKSLCENYTMKYNNNTWTVEKMNTNEVVAEAASLGMHPTTVLQNEWRMKDSKTGLWYDSFLYFEHTNLESSFDSPLSMHEIGYDFFMRKKMTQIVWYEDPSTGMIFHSAAKQKNDVFGRRYCCICGMSFSANNFVSQHMRKHPTISRMQSPIVECIFWDEI